jgi:hypothetical protein
VATPTVDGVAADGSDDQQRIRMPGRRRPLPADEPRPQAGVPTLIEHRQRPWRKVLTYPVLYVMALADAFGFWNTLSQVIKSDTTLVLVFVIAMSIGAVAVPHVAGQLVRSRMVGYGGSILWIAVLGALWLLLGTVMCWLRWSTPVNGAVRRSGPLADKVAAAGSGSGDAMRIAILLLVVFLITGALAMTHGYRFGDPRSPELRAALARRAALERELADHRLSVADAEGDFQKILEDQRRARRSRTYEHEIHQARTDELRSQARARIAQHVADPEGTDVLNEDWPPAPPLPRTQPDFDRFRPPSPTADDDVI